MDKSRVEEYGKYVGKIYNFTGVFEVSSTVVYESSIWEVKVIFKKIFANTNISYQDSKKIVSISK